MAQCRRARALPMPRAGARHDSPARARRPSLAERRSSRARPYTGLRTPSMASVDELSRGTVARLLDGDTPASPCMQVLAVKPLAGASGAAQRYRLLLSDGGQTITAMLSTQMNHVADDPNAPLELALVCMEQYTVNEVAGKKIVILIQIAIKTPGDVVGHKLGDPSTAPPQARAPCRQRS